MRRERETDRQRDTATDKKRQSTNMAKYFSQGGNTSCRIIGARCTVLQLFYRFGIFPSKKLREQWKSTSHQEDTNGRGKVAIYSTKEGKCHPQNPQGFMCTTCRTMSCKCKESPKRKTGKRIVKTSYRRIPKWSTTHSKVWVDLTRD